jgi:dTDP-4-dehydrorhamnose reductase
VECTVNRVGDQYFEQTARSGHQERLSDFELFQQLGVRAIRHGVLWEKVAPEGLQQADWHWADVSLARIKQLGMRPIIGLVHHGSGPYSTSLLDPHFPEKLAGYARAVAERYPWVNEYTPVNEPLTTARFSALYGHWYPHAQDDRTFFRTLLNQCRAVVLAMRAIREINPAAKLIQTDDLGKTFSTPKLAYQAAMENERRWLSYDLLCGRLDNQHAMWGYLRREGVSEGELAWFCENPCPPDVVGINHYLSGQRFLDEHLHRYPPSSHGGNGRHDYADVLASRVLLDGAATPAQILLEAWDRYKLPVAVTECHNGCTREEQLRWFLEVWRGAELAARCGADIVAVTAWSLLGAFDWDSLVTRNNGRYEPGVYDIRSPKPRATALTSLASELAEGNRPQHPVLDVDGWWRRPQRFVYGFALDCDGAPVDIPHESVSSKFASVRPVVITGARGALAREFARACEHRGIVFRSLTRTQCNIADVDSVRRALDTLRPWAVINAAGYSRIDDAESARARCFRDNSRGAAVLAAECARAEIQLLTFTSAMVFSGDQDRPYVEDDEVNPLNCYGRSQADAEALVRDAMPSALIARAGPFFGANDTHNWLAEAMRRLFAGDLFPAITDVKISPTYVPDLVNVTLDLLIDRESGIWHLANAGQVSWEELMKKAAGAAKLSTRSLIPCSIAELHLPAARPRYSVLTSTRGSLMPSLEDALERYAADLRSFLEPESAAA